MPGPSYLDKSPVLVGFQERLAARSADPVDLRGSLLHMATDEVILALHPHPQWLNLVRLTTREYCAAIEFSPALVEMVESCVQEACEELIGICTQRSLKEGFELHFGSEGESLVVQLVCSVKASLDPMEARSREAPAEEPPPSMA